jgi:two-component system cell cycle sensor histidine kinase/response regulator CckA
MHGPTTSSSVIHPENRETVVAAMLTKQIQGDYNETYRIKRPYGSIRWIHDKAFPIRDQTGRGLSRDGETNLNQPCPASC